MSTILELDKFNRESISKIFRGCIIFYSILLLLNHGIKYHLIINVVVFSIYILVYLFLHNKNNWMSIFRLINDYSFITFILLQTKVPDISTFALLLAPILNNHNHSGNKKTILLYIIPIIILWIVLPKFIPLIILPFLFFRVINSFDDLRAKYFNFQQKLNSVIDNFFIDDKWMDFVHV